MRLWIMMAVAMLAPGAGAAMAQDRLSVCATCVSPSVQTASGIGTARASVVARITQADVQAWCEMFEPDDDADEDEEFGVKACMKRQLATPAMQREYRASADCTSGTIIAVNGRTYRLDGTWPPGELGAGRSRWRDAGGELMDPSNAGGGLDIAQQWEVLCPGPRSGGAGRR